MKQTRLQELQLLINELVEMEKTRQANFDVDVMRDKFGSIDPRMENGCITTGFEALGTAYILKIIVYKKETNRLKKLGFDIFNN